MKYNFFIKHKLTEEEFVECFNFMKTYLVSIYGEDAISANNFNLWKANRTEKDNRFFIKILKEQETCGYAEIMILDNKVLYFCDIIIKEEMRRTRVVYEFVKYVLKLEMFKEFEDIYLHINKSNKTSYSTWLKLGLIEVEEGKNSNKYKLLRKNVENYFNKGRAL